MLLEFRFKNFRSFREEQTLTLAASGDKSLETYNTAPSGVKAVPRVVLSAVVYGANAGGKSNLLRALQFMAAVVTQSAAMMQAGETFNYQPFRLDRSSTEAPSEFEVTFTLGGVRYQYGFSLEAHRVLHEYLLVYKAFKPQQWFERTFDKEHEKYVYDFGVGLKGQKTVWENATRPNALFLSTAVQLNSDQLRPVFDWFAHHLVVFNELSPLSRDRSVEMLRNSEGRNVLCRFLRAADISISDIEVVTKRVPAKTFYFDLARGKSEIREEEQEVNELRFLHESEGGSAFFSLNDESMGTRNLLFLTGPILTMLNQGTVLVVDELDNSLHPLLVRRLVKLFHDPALNKNGAQLIFTTHDTSLLDTELFRRDQVWLVEKEEDQSSKLYPLSDFSPRKNEALAKGYLLGRYGGLPFLEGWQESEER